MNKTALNTYLEPEQKTQLERLAERDGVSQATMVREAIADYLRRRGHDDAPAVSESERWGRLRDGYYEGDGTANNHDDIYR